MQYIFDAPIPLPWLLPDLLVLLLSLWVILFVVKKSQYPLPSLLEGFCFVFLYASLFENFAVVQGWYVYGESYLMVGDVPLSVPLIEMDVLILGLWLLQKFQIPDWCKPFIVGLMGMLQDFSLDPVAVRQVFTSNGIESGRWSWLFDKAMVNIYNIPVYNFPGWMLIMLYGSAYILLGRWWFRRSDYKPVVGYIYPFLALLLALVTMVSPLSNFLLWLQPFSSKGSNTEWIMLAFHLLFPSALLIIFWRGKMNQPLSLRKDLPVFAVPALLHLCDILCAISGGFSEVLWLVLLASAVHVTLLGWIFMQGSAARFQKPSPIKL
jgi:hypothetical protein